MQSWYSQLNKPNWAPTADVFGKVWSILYPIIFFVNVMVIVLLAQQKISLRVATPFWINLVANFFYVYVQFGLRNQLLSSITIIIVLITIFTCMIAIWPHAKYLSLLYAPYAIWVAIATILQLSITYMNR
jgi:translocator protein